MKALPEIRKYNGIDTLFVDNEPFIILGGEIHNSSASNLEYMAKKVWPSLEGLNMNTLIVPIYWDLVEEKEGIYDFTLIDGLIEQARDNNMHLVLLWFGLWKNSESTYIPTWMKKDLKTYFRARKVNGEALNTISPLCQLAIEKDANALTRIMERIKEIDENENTVIAIQIENEIGLLGTDRDYSNIAEKEFVKNVPYDLEKEFSVHGNWSECFGNESGEFFMAYYFAKAVEYITESAKRIYNLPCYANAWLKQYPWFPGSYPSGGPVVSMHKIWKLMAPSLFCLAPDIYVPYVPKIMEEYSQNGNPLFIPEVRKDAVTASYALYAFGKYNTICYSPFAIEEFGLKPDEIIKPPMELLISLNIDPSAFDIEGSKEYLSSVYKLMEEIKPIYFRYRNTKHLKSYVKTSEIDYGTFLEFDRYNLQIAYNQKQPLKPLAAGMIYEVGENSFYIIGMMSNIKVFPKLGENKKVDILKLEEGVFENGKWIRRRILNGDEKMVLQLNDKLTCYYVEFYKYE